MIPRQAELALKKQRLQAQSAALREKFADQAGRFRPLFVFADRGVAAAYWVKRHPGVPVAVMTALLVARPRSLLRWLRRGWVAWRSFGKLKTFIDSRLVAHR